MCVYSVAILIKEKRSKNKKYTYLDFLATEIEEEIGEPRVEVPSSIRKAVEKLAEDGDLKLVRHLGIDS